MKMQLGRILNVSWHRSLYKRWIELTLGYLPSMLYVRLDHHDWLWLFVWQVGRIRSEWNWHKGRWHLRHRLTFHQPSYKWHTLFYDGNYQSGDWVHLPVGQTWKCGQQETIVWP